MKLFGINFFEPKPEYNLVPVRLNVPHFCQEGKQECGIFSTMMVLKYFGIRNPDRQRIKRMAELPYGEGSIYYGLGKALTSYGIGAEIVIYKRTRNNVVKNLERELSEKGISFEEFSIDVEQMKENAIRAGVKVEVRDIALNEVLSRTDSDTLPMVTLNPNRFFGSRQMGVHCVVITGFDDNRVYYHDPMFYSNGNNVANKKTFAKAMSDVGGAVIFASRRKAK